jgi:preprotein translocase subunit SecF
MNSPKFLKMFAMIEMLSAMVFISLAVITYLSLDKLGGDLMIPLVFGIIGGCALIAAPVLFTIAKKRESESNSPIEY